MKEQKKAIPEPPKEVVYQKEIQVLDNGIQSPLPAAHDLEQVILGALIIDSTTRDYIKLIEPKIFDDKKHRVIMEAIKSLYESGEAIDLLMVSNELKRTGKTNEAGTDYYVTSLITKISSSAHIDFHFRVVLQKYALREMIFMSRKTMYSSLHRDPDIFKLMESIKSKIAEIENVVLRKNDEDSKDAKTDLKERVEMQRKGVSPGFPTGIDTFDNWRGGLLPRWLVTLAARPGMGKTTAVIAMIIHMVIEKGIPVVFFSLEMSAIDLKYKMAAGMTEIDFQKINSGQLTNEELDLVNQALDKIDESPLRIIDDLKDLEIIVSETRKLAQEGFRVFFLDYVQLVETPNSKENETAKLTETTRKLRAVKNELNILFVQLAQLSREPDKRPGHRPQLSDLKMSGSLEEDSDMVIFILRPEYYNKDKAKVPPAPGKPNPEYIAEWIVAKGRATGVADFDIYIDFSLMKMESFSGIQF